MFKFNISDRDHKFLPNWWQLPKRRLKLMSAFRTTIDFKLQNLWNLTVFYTRQLNHIIKYTKFNIENNFKFGIQIYIFSNFSSFSNFFLPQFFPFRFNLKSSRKYYLSRHWGIWDWRVCDGRYAVVFHSHIFCEDIWEESARV